MYVVTSPTDVSAIYKNNTTLSWDAMLDDLLTAFGVSAQSIPTLWQKPSSDLAAEMGPDKIPQNLSIVHSTLDLYKRQLLPGERLDKFSHTLLSYIDVSLRCEHASARGLTKTRISLKDFCSEVLVDALTRTLFGDGIFEVEPNMVQNLLDFNDDAWMLIFHYPQSAASKLNKARHNILEAFVKYIQGPESTRSGQAWLIHMIMQKQKAANISDKDRAALLLMVYWA